MAHSGRQPVRVTVILWPTSAVVRTYSSPVAPSTGAPSRFHWWEYDSSVYRQVLVAYSRVPTLVTEFPTTISGAGGSMYDSAGAIAAVGALVRVRLAKASFDPVTVTVMALPWSNSVSV
ncbi:hypothetical protein D9M72_554820 [compost metagenome]